MTHRRELGPAVPCHIHGGPMDGRSLMLQLGINEMQVPMVREGSAMGCRLGDNYDLAFGGPSFDTFRYVISLEQYPIPASGPTLIGYPKL